MINSGNSWLENSFTSFESINWQLYKRFLHAQTIWIHDSNIDFLIEIFKRECIRVKFVGMNYLDPSLEVRFRFRSVSTLGSPHLIHSLFKSRCKHPSLRHSFRNYHPFQSIKGTCELASIHKWISTFSDAPNCAIVYIRFWLSLEFLVESSI